MPHKQGFGKSNHYTIRTMNDNTIKKLLTKVKKGDLTIENALESFKELPYKDLGFAKVDNHRTIRCGFPEVIFCEGKTPEQVLKIASQIIKHGADLLATRANEEIFKCVSQQHKNARYNDKARTIVIKKSRSKKKKGLILIVTAGTSDIPVAEEARETAEIMGNNVKVLYDVGVAGIHPLLAMLNSCAANVTVVNIDNGFGAAYVASLINSTK